MKWSLLVCLVLLAGGCATGFDRGAVEQRLRGDAVQYDHDDIRHAMENRPRISFPIKVAVHLIAETHHARPARPQSAPREADDGGQTAYGEEDVSSDWRWTDRDKQMIESWGEDLRQAGLVEDLFIMSRLVSKSDDLQDIRMAAARQGADAVQVIKSVSQTDRYLNPAAILNALIIPGWFVPGSECDVLMMMRGAMWDVTNEYLYLGIESEAEIGEVGPTFVLENEEVLARTRTLALEGFGEEFKEHFRKLK